MKIVIDANLFASGLIKPDSNPGRILDLIERNQVELILSPPIIREIKRILLYPRLQKYHQKTAKYCLKIQGASNKIHACLYCAKVFSTKGNLDVHIKSCKKRKPSIQQQTIDDLKLQIKSLLQYKKKAQLSLVVVV